MPPGITRSEFIPSLRFFEVYMVDDMSRHFTVGFFMGAGAWEED